MTSSPPSSAARASSVARDAIGLISTLLLGLWLRWYLAGVGVPLPTGTTYSNLRHAHSHLGYYAVLVPLAWLAAEASSGRKILGRQAMWFYAGSILIATVGFLQAGYGLLGIIGSTAVSLFWLVAAWRIASRARAPDDPLVAVLPGTLLSLLCIPLIASSLRSNPAFAASAVQSFLTILLFLVIAPGAVAALGLRQRWGWGTVATGAMAALSLGLWPSAATRIGLALHACYWLDTAWRIEARVFAVPWYAGAIGLLAVAAGVVPLSHDVAIGAIHFLILGPFLSALAHHRVSPRLPAHAWWWHHGGTALLAGPLVLRGLTVADTRWTGIASAIGGSLIVSWWLVVLVRPSLPSARGVESSNP